MVKEDAHFQLNFHVVVGCFNANKEVLEELAKIPEIYFYITMTQAELIKADVAVSGRWDDYIRALHSRNTNS